MKQILKKLISFFPFLLFKKGNRVIFIYHDISDSNSVHHSANQYSTTISNFRKQLNFIYRNFTLISIDEIIKDNLPKNKNYASIVFDDGFESIQKNANPLLKKLEIPYAIFANKNAVLNNQVWLSDLKIESNFIENKGKVELLLGYSIEVNTSDDLIEFLKNNKEFNNKLRQFNFIRSAEKIYLNVEDLVKLKKEGVVIGSHTCNHPVLSNCSEDIQFKEINDNKKFLDEVLQQNTIHFAHPFGKKEHFNETTMKSLKEIGHKYAYTSNPDFIKTSDSYFIPRMGILNQSVSEMRFMINRTFIKKTDL